MDNFLIGLTTFVMLLNFVSMVRVLRGPTIADRIVALSAISTKVTILILTVAILTNQESYIDVALVYALTGFIASIVIVRYLEKGKVV